ncbi:hypothetical protein MVLG_05698 [Microbotryum lychnidis-dioicae p1A1 Lamole]|uniref:Ubiquitin-like protease family profile domain-containing protein n=1 Tax=Microbotryum lychnidis-dioicae (strain p1A1 Lamole / MvSl-1064) TaxID=683840 RepID=U5HF10_USTV1|nr:hypothetical protein MVLG_05698 [Microbotryum lychnidis-dioicae p1A1 Lamole]|eukprot:KDE03813.1 hypothetical protein MVLG_05698 [Microbotryum lychnidis-dioicae p1A1 Lamole]
MAILVASGKHQPDSPQREVLDKYIFASPLVPYRTLADLRSFVRARPLSIWFLPLCFRDHWAMARVDVGQRTWTLFNSLSHIRIDEITRNSALALFDYLELHILNTEPKQGRMAQQADGSSCGPAAINVGETELLLVPPFSAGRAHIARICQFHRLATFATKSQHLTHDLPAPIAGIDRNELDVEEMAEIEDDEET